MQSRQEILLGLSISVTGMFSAQGRQALDGLRLWQSYVNDRDGITLGQNGPRQVRVVFYDHQSLASLARQAIGDNRSCRPTRTNCTVPTVTRIVTMGWAGSTVIRLA